VPLKPHQIRYCADRRDLEERAEHIEEVLSAVLDYVGVIVRDTAHVAPGGSIDQEYLLGLITYVASDVVGFIAMRPIGWGGTNHAPSQALPM
jgi:hypothetical protein